MTKGWLSRLGMFLGRMKKYVAEIRFKEDLVTMEDLIVKALPYLDTAACIAAGIMPKNVLAIELAVINTSFPKLFDGTIHTHDELTSYILGVAANLLEQHNHSINTTMARTAVQIAYFLRKHDPEAAKAVEKV